MAWKMLNIRDCSPLKPYHGLTGNYHKDFLSFLLIFTPSMGGQRHWFFQLPVSKFMITFYLEK